MKTEKGIEYLLKEHELDKRRRKCEMFIYIA